MILGYLLQKEFIQIRRNKFLPKLIVVFPIVIICIMPWVMSMEVKNIKVEVVDNDRSMTSSRLVQRIASSNYFIFEGMSNSYDQAMADVESGKIDVFMEIPQHYERDLVNHQKPKIQIAANAANSTTGQMGSSYLGSIIATNTSEAMGTTSYATVGTASTMYLNNPSLNYKVFMIPALMGILIMMMCGFLPTLNIVSEKETGTIEQINVTPVKKWEFILGKLIPYWIMGLLVMTIALILSWAIYGITCQGSLLWMYLLAMLLALFFSGFGLTVSNYSDNMQQAVFVMWFFVLLLMMVSGIFTPARSMPELVQRIITIDPMYYFIEAIRTIFVRGGNFSDIAKQVYILTGFAIVMNVWAVISYKKNS